VPRDQTEQVGLSVCADIAVEVLPSSEGLLAVSVLSAGAAADAAAVRLLAAAVKGGLPPPARASPLRVVNVDGPPGLVLRLVRAVLYPRLLLQAAQLRQVQAAGHTDRHASRQVDRQARSSSSPTA
jgi:hypothetical protein